MLRHELVDNMIHVPRLEDANAAELFPGFRIGAVRRRDFAVLPIQGQRGVPRLLVDLGWRRARLRRARLDGPRSRIIAVGEKISRHSTFYRSYLLQRERRTLVQASHVWHFRNTHVVRPFVGGGAGILWWKGDASCPTSLIECERVLPNGAPGRLEHTTMVVGFTGGVACQAPNGVIVRSGIRAASRLNDFVRNGRQSRIEDLPRGLPEYFASIGYRW